MRLIDADALKIDLMNLSEETGMSIIGIFDLINNAPTVEPRIEYDTDGQPYRLFMSGSQVVPDMLQGWRYEERPKGKWESTIPENPTNGDMLLTKKFRYSWWNAPYKRGDV